MSKEINRRSLCLPKSGKIREIIHLSDLHIRSGDYEESRYIEYDNVITTLIKDLSNIKSIKDECAIIVILGDIFHNKNKIESSGLMLFNKLIRGLSNLAPVYMIHGNHDYRQDQQNAPDMISSILSINKIHNVEYLEDTAIYDAGDYEFGTISCKDTLRQGNTSGQVDELPVWPKTNPDKRLRIALFHGTVTKSRLQNYQETNEGYPLEWIKGYDIILLGDIHLQQLHNVKDDGSWEEGKIPWGYCGSLIQQNFGEPINGHGYIVWDLDNRKSRMCHVYNNSGLLYVRYNNGWEVNINSKWKLLKEEVDNIPKQLKIRIKGEVDIIKKEELEVLLKMHEIRCNKMTQVIIDDEIDDKINKDDDIKMDEIINNSQKVEYICEDNDIDKSKVKEWLGNMRNMLIKEDEVPDEIIESLNRRNKDIQIMINNKDTYEKEQKQLIKNTITLETLEWSWLISYTKNCWINFRTMNGKICLIEGANDAGKSSLMEIICLSIFGEAIESRYNKEYSSGIINYQKPHGDSANTRLRFKLDNKEYILERRFIDRGDDKIKAEGKGQRLYEIENLVNPYKEGQSAINEWIHNNIGDINTFLLTCMVTQNQDRDFFSLNKKDQMYQLDSTLSLERVNDDQEIFNEIIKEYTYIIKQITPLQNLLKQETKGYDVKLIEDIKANKLVLEEELKRMVEEKSKIENEITLTAGYDAIRSIDLNNKDDLDEKIAKNIERLVSNEKIRKDNKLTVIELLENKGKLENKLDQVRMYLKYDMNESEKYLEEELMSLEKNEIRKPDINDDIIIKRDEYKSKWGGYIGEDIGIIVKEMVTLENALNDERKVLVNIIENTQKKPKYSKELHMKWIKDKKKFERDNKLICETYVLMKERIKEPSITREYLDGVIKQLSKEKEKIGRITDYDEIKLRKRQDELCKLIEDKKKKNDENRERREKIDNELEVLNERIKSNDNKLKKYKGYLIPEKGYDIVNDWIRNMMKLRNIYPIYKKIHDMDTEINRMDKEYEDIQKYIKDNEEKYKEIPYNAECWACQKQPHICHMKELNKKKEDVYNTMICLKNERKDMIKKNRLMRNKDVNNLVHWMNEYRIMEQMEEFYNKQRDIWEKYKDIKPLKEENDVLRDEIRSIHEEIKLCKIEDIDDIVDEYNDIIYYLENKARWEYQEQFIKEQRDIIDKYEIYNRRNMIDAKVREYKDGIKIWEKEREEYDEYIKYVRLRIESENKISGYENRIKELMERKNKMEEYLRDNDEIMRINKMIKEYEEWEAYDNRIKTYQACLYKIRLEENERMINVMMEYDELVKNKKYYEVLREMRPKIRKLDEIKDEIRNKEKEYNKMITAMEINRIKEEEYRDRVYKMEVLATKVRNLEIKQVEIERIRNRMLGYKVWLYEKRIMPKLLKSVNDIAGMVEGSDEYRLEVKITADGGIIWLITDKKNKTEIRKGGGFRRFLFSLALRLTLSYIRGNSVMCKQLFIDEGFVCADKSNLQRIPDFLKSLMRKKLYDTIILVSHLDVLKEGSDISIPIKREDKVSLIQYGDIDKQKVKVVGRKKMKKCKNNNEEDDI